MRLTIMCGLPDSGKTTKANEIAEETGAVCIHQDSYYDLILSGEGKVTSDTPQLVTEMAYADIRSHLQNGDDVIYDAICGFRIYRRRLIEIAREAGAEVVCVYMDTPIEVRRARSHNGFVLELDIEPPTDEEGFDAIITITPDEEGDKKNESD